MFLEPDRIPSDPRDSSAGGCSAHLTGEAGGRTSCSHVRAATQEDRAQLLGCIPDRTPGLPCLPHTGDTVAEGVVTWSSPQPESQGDGRGP